MKALREVFLWLARLCISPAALSLSLCEAITEISTFVEASSLKWSPQQSLFCEPSLWRTSQRRLLRCHRSESN